MKIGAYLRELRKRGPRGHIPMRHVVRDLKVPRQTVYLWESLQSRIDPQDIRRLCTYLGATEEQIAEALRLRSLLPEEQAAEPERASA